MYLNFWTWTCSLLRKFKHRPRLQGIIESTALLHPAGYALHSPFPHLSHTVKWKGVQNPPANQCVCVGGGCGRDPAALSVGSRWCACMWFFNQAERKHVVNRVCLLSINTLILDTYYSCEREYGLYLTPSLTCCLSIIICCSCFLQLMFLYMILCLSVTIYIVSKMGWGNLHALFHWGLETCLARRNVCCGSSPYGRWQ